MSAEVQLFAGCLAEGCFPHVAEAATAVISRLGVVVRPIRDAFCCGQMAFNEGLRSEARKLAHRLLRVVENSDLPIVIPSGSCTAMVRVFYSDLFADDAQMLERVERLRGRVYEFSEFLVKHLNVADLDARFERRVAYHPSCHLVRELRVTDAPLSLLKAVKGLTLCTFDKSEECCGFGGLFSVKFPHISAAMLQDKIFRVRASGAQVLTSCDLGCLMHIGGGLHRQRVPIETRHLAEILATR